MLGNVLLIFRMKVSSFRHAFQSAVISFQVKSNFVELLDCQNSIFLRQSSIFLKHFITFDL